MENGLKSTTPVTPRLLWITYKHRRRFGNFISQKAKDKMNCEDDFKVGHLVTLEHNCRHDARYYGVVTAVYNESYRIRWLRTGQEWLYHKVKLKRVYLA